MGRKKKPTAANDSVPAMALPTSPAGSTSTPSRGERLPDESPVRVAPRGTVRIRMYNTGFGDCFLLRFPGTDRERKVLIDCGKHTHSTCKPPIQKIVSQVLADIRDSDGTPRIDLVVATHRHLDHVSGFAVEGWDDVEVGEVWMPWTEDPDDPVARRICERQSLRALQLHREMIPRLNLSPARRDYLLGYAGNNLTNSTAMRVLHEGFQGAPRRRFLPTAASGPGQVQTQLLPGVEVYVLGPSRNEGVIRDMDPPQGESFLRYQSASAGSTEVSHAPFSECWTLDRDQYIAWFVGRNLPDPLSDFTEQSAAHLRKQLENPEMELAATLEKSVNGTSLVLLFKLGRAVLLFPGDAQWGTWNEILRDERWRHLLQSVSFYKVGHHGSHNATPRRFVDEFLPPTACAMIPTDNVAQWPTIPKPALLERLRQQQVHFVRSDRADSGDDPRFRRQALPDGETLCVDLDAPI